MKLVEWFTTQLACHLRCQVSSTVGWQQTFRQRDLIEKQNLTESPSCFTNALNNLLTFALWKNQLENLIAHSEQQHGVPETHGQKSRYPTQEYQHASTWPSKLPSLASKPVSSSRPAPLRRHNPVSFRFPSSFPSLEGRSPPLRMWPNRAQTYLDSAISSLWDRNSACLSSLVSLHSICDARDERGALLTHFRALFLPKPS